MKMVESLFSLLLIWTSIALAIIFAILQMDWLIVFVSISTLLLTTIPFILENRYRFFIPIGFTAAIAIFIYAAIILGEVHDFYETFWWWDSILHLASAVGFGLIGVVVLLLLYRGEKVRAHPYVLSLFAFLFAVAMGALWEVFEFSMDELFGFNMQKNGLHDTMWDLIVDGIGGIIGSFSGYLYITKGKKNFLNSIIHEWVTHKKSTK
jgi:hypothetical protein